MSWSPEQKPRTALPFIIHQADLMAARIEFEKEWLPKFQNISSSSASNNFKLDTTKTPTEKKVPIKTKALSNVSSESLKNILDNL